MFLGIVFLYPSTEQGTFEEKEKLKEHLTGMCALPAVNRAADANQMFYVDNGVATFLVGHTKDELSRNSSGVQKRSSSSFRDVGSR